MRRRFAFTLAEVLITLGIIGVVAAMTIPVLVQKYKEQATVTRVKKFYSVFSQAYTMAINEMVQLIPGDLKTPNWLRMRKAILVTVIIHLSSMKSF